MHSVTPSAVSQVPETLPMVQAAPAASPLHAVTRGETGRQKSVVPDVSVWQVPSTTPASP
jgi:hypothetical protein